MVTMLKNYLIKQSHCEPLRENLAHEKSAKTVEKDSTCESGSLHCVYRQKTTIYRLQDCEIRYFENYTQNSQ